jgi:hypothetical protein
VFFYGLSPFVHGWVRLVKIILISHPAHRVNPVLLPIGLKIFHQWLRFVICEFGSEFLAPGGVLASFRSDGDPPLLDNLKI